MDSQPNQNISIFDMHSCVNLSNKAVLRSLKEAKDSEIFKAPLSRKRKISITFILMSLYQGFKLMTEQEPFPCRLNIYFNINVLEMV